MRYSQSFSLLLLVCLLCSPCFQSAHAAEDIRDLHRTVAGKMLETLAGGAALRGKVEQNGSVGSFEAYFFEDSYLIREQFGPMVSESYRGAEGSYSGGNFCLPYKIEAGDSPASTSLGLLSSGAYLEDPYWPQFTYVGEEAGGYRFKFTPEGLPPVDVLLYSDSELPEYLQLMSSEVDLAPMDPESFRHRSFYYYAKDPQGRLYTSRETGSELDHRGMKVNVSDYSVESFESLTARPAELAFDSTRKPVGAAGAGLAAAVTVPIDTATGFFVVPVTFAGGTTLKFILDTGASASLLAPNAVAASGIETSMVTTAHGHGTRQEFELGMVSGALVGTPDGAQVPLAPFPATKIPNGSREMLEALDSFGCAGILGLAPFHQYVVTLDHAAKNMVFHPQQLFDPASSLPGAKLTYTLDAEDLIYVTARINDSLTGQIALDTGLQQDLALLKETIDAAGLVFNKVGESQNTVVGGKRNFDYVQVPSFDLGPLRLEGKIATITEDDRGMLAARHLLGFIGLSLFTQARITLDLFAQRMYVEPPAELLEVMQSNAPGLFEGLADDKYVKPAAGAPMPFGGPSQPPAADPLPVPPHEPALPTAESSAGSAGSGA